MCAHATSLACRTQRHYAFPTVCSHVRGQNTPVAHGRFKLQTGEGATDKERVRRVLAHSDKQSDEEAVAEDEASYESTTHTAMEIPVELVPQVREYWKKRGGSDCGDAG